MVVPVVWLIVSDALVQAAGLGTVIVGVAGKKVWVPDVAKVTVRPIASAQMAGVGLAGSF